MSKEQILKFMNKSFGLDINEYKKLSKLFSFYISKDEFLELDKFYKFYYDILIEDKSKLKELKSILYDNINVENILYDNINVEIKGIDIIWNSLYNLGYNNILEKKNEYNLNNILVDSNQFEDNEYFKNLLQLSNIKIYKLSLLGLFIDKILIQYLNEKYFFKNIKVIKISIPHFHEFIKLKIKFPNLEELTFYINKKLKYNDINEINKIFPNIKSLNLYIYNNIDLINLFNNIKYLKIDNLTIIFFMYEKYNYSKKKDEIILNNIINLRIEINKDYCFTNQLLEVLFNNIKFPNLESYILYFNMNKFENMKRIGKRLKFFYTFYNCFFIFFFIFNSFLV